MNYLVVKGTSVTALKISSIGFFGCFFFRRHCSFFFIPSSFSFLFFFPPPPPPLVGRLFYVGSSVKVISVSIFKLCKVVGFIYSVVIFADAVFFYSAGFFSPPLWSLILFRRFLRRHRSLFLYSAVSVS